MLNACKLLHIAPLRDGINLIILFLYVFAKEYSEKMAAILYIFNL